MEKMKLLMESKNWKNASITGNKIRLQLSNCKFKKEYHDMWKLDRPILNVDLSHIKTFDDMQTLVKQKYIKINILPPEMLQESKNLADSHYNILYVDRKAEEQFRNVHATLNTLLDESENIINKNENKNIQIDIKCNRIYATSFIPNKITYMVRGFTNIDLVVNIW
jgi:hypothetical protein